MVDMIGLAYLAAGIAPETPQKVSLADEILQSVRAQREALRRLAWYREDKLFDRHYAERQKLDRLTREFGALLERVRELEEGR